MSWVDRLIERAKRTPYYHLTGYMNRWWLVPYGRRVLRAYMVPHPDMSTDFFWVVSPPWLEIETYDGTGPVAFREHPIAWCIQRLGLSIRIHEILRSDMGRDPHDHPWWYLSIILRGTYWERRFDDRGRCISRKMHGPGSILFRRRAHSWHMLELYQGTVTTLFITGRKVDGHWGFNVEGTKVPRREYEAKHGRPWA